MRRAYVPFFKRAHKHALKALELNHGEPFYWKGFGTPQSLQVPNEAAQKYLAPYVEEHAELTQEWRNVHAWGIRTTNKFEDTNIFTYVLPTVEGKNSLEDAPPMSEADRRVVLAMQNDPEYLLYLKRIFLGTML